MLKSQKGITLIALIIIIVFLMLVLLYPIINTIIYNKAERNEQLLAIEKRKEYDRKLEIKNKEKKKLSEEIDLKNLIDLSKNNVQNSTNTIEDNNIVENETIEVAEIIEEKANYEGSFYVDRDINIKEYIELTVPDVFVNDSANNAYVYYYSSEGSDHFFDCKLSLTCPKYYDNPEELAEKISEYYEGYPVIKENFANKKWYTTYYRHNDSEITYICTTEKDGYAFLLEFMVDYEYNDKDTLERYFDEIKNNLKFLK